MRSVHLVSMNNIEGSLADSSRSNWVCLISLRELSTWDHMAKIEDFPSLSSLWLQVCQSPFLCRLSVSILYGDASSIPVPVLTRIQIQIRMACEKPFPPPFCQSKWAGEFSFLIIKRETNWRYPHQEKPSSRRGYPLVAALFQYLVAEPVCIPPSPCQGPEWLLFGGLHRRHHSMYFCLLQHHT